MMLPGMLYHSSLPPLPTPPRGSHSRACAVWSMRATASASARASASAPESPLGRAPGGWGAVPRCASPCLVPAPRVPAPLAPVLLLSILRPGSNPRSHRSGRARHWEGAATGEGLIWLSGGDPLCRPLPKGGNSRGGRAAVPQPPAPDPCPRPQHARPAGVTGSARSRPAAQPGALAGHSDRRPGAMSHEAARQQLPAATPGGLQPGRRLPRPLSLPRRPGAGPRATLPPAPRPSAASARRLVPAPRLGGLCAQWWVWPVPFLLPFPWGPWEEREGHAGACTLDVWVPSLAFERLSVDLCTLLSPKPRFMLVHFWKSVSVAFTKDPFQ